MWTITTGTISLRQLPRMFATEAMVVARVREEGLNQVLAILEGVFRNTGFAIAPRVWPTRAT